MEPSKISKLLEILAKEKEETLLILQQTPTSINMKAASEVVELNFIAASRHIQNDLGPREYPLGENFEPDPPLYDSNEEYSWICDRIAFHRNTMKGVVEKVRQGHIVRNTAELYR